MGYLDPSTLGFQHDETAAGLLNVLCKDRALSVKRVNTRLNRQRSSDLLRAQRPLSKDKPRDGLASKISVFSTGVFNLFPGLRVDFLRVVDTRPRCVMHRLDAVFGAVTYLSNKP
jgi:hypothetical protein